MIQINSAYVLQYIYIKMEISMVFYFYFPAKSILKSLKFNKDFLMCLLIGWRFVARQTKSGFDTILDLNMEWYQLRNDNPLC